MKLTNDFYFTNRRFNERGKIKTQLPKKEKNERKERGNKRNRRGKTSVKFIKNSVVKKRKGVEEEKDESDTEFFNSSVV